MYMCVKLQILFKKVPSKTLPNYHKAARFLQVKQLPWDLWAILARVLLSPPAFQFF